MNWTNFRTYNEAPTRAFEALCNQIFELWVNRNYLALKKSFVVVNGAGGDGGVEAYAALKNGEEIGVQAKWFPDRITASQFNQIRDSILTALKVHKNLKKYIVCVPRDLSNVKLGKNGNIVKDTEYSKWEKCVSDVKKKYPSIEIYFWGDSVIMEQLQYSEAAGVRQYWFEKEELTKEKLQYSYDKQREGWLAHRYISTLHNQGRIHEMISSFLGNQQECDILLKEFVSMEKKYNNLHRELFFLCGLLEEQNKYEEEREKIQEINKRVLAQLEEMAVVREAFKQEIRLNAWVEHVMVDELIFEIKEWVKGRSYGEYRSHFWATEKALDAVCEIRVAQVYNKMQQRNSFDKMIIMGAQGTGKTHGIANEVQVLLNEGYVMPILIQAKSVNNNEEWKDIIIRNLGLACIWGEEELFAALEALSYRIEVNHPLVDDGVKIVPKILICVDGIDELKPYSRWQERINQVNAIVARHPRIRFCFTGRPYAFDKTVLLQEPKYRTVYLSDDGDVPVRELYESYIHHYSVDDEGAKWLKYSLSTPYALKLLCEIYQGKSISNFGKSDVTITELLKKKFISLEQELKTSLGLDESIKIQIIKTVLIMLDEMFLGKNEINCSDIKEALRKNAIYNYLNEIGLDLVLDFLEKQSFLQSYQKSAQSIFETEETVYLLGVQPVYDYLKAMHLYERGPYTDNMQIEESFLENISVMQMYSVMILERDRKTIWQNKSCRDYFYEDELFKLVAFALVNVSVECSQQHQNWVEEIMRKNAYALGKVVNYIILPLARYAHHPLGSELLDNYLMEFDKPAKRDLLWSVPSELYAGGMAKWIRDEEIAYSDKLYYLGLEDVYDGLPLVWAWGLSSVSNHQRAVIRKGLTKWGITQSEEFYKLFLHFSDINDPQIGTDLFAIAMSVTYMNRNNHTFLKKISGWIMKNIFSYGKIVNIRNAAIRYYARAIMECAYSEKVITLKQIEKCRPPYRINNKLLSFSPEATEGTLMNGYKLLDYDLARYVLGDPINRMFLGNRSNREGVNLLLEKYQKRYCLQELSTDKFIIGCAYGYIEQTGWNEDEFYGKPNGGQANEIIGLDIAIIRKYFPATHGSMSIVMSVTEKYAWCAKMEILGYLADRFQFATYDKISFVSDYGVMEDYINPYQEVCQKDIDSIMAENELLLPENLAPLISEYPYSADGIRNWIIKSPIPNFSKWIQVDQEEITLHATHFINNEDQGVTTMMWISSGLIIDGTIQKLSMALKNKEFLYCLSNPADFYAYPDTDCYISPLEVCWFDWKEEWESSITFGSNVLNKNVAKCVCNMQELGENTYEVPSKLLRNILEITEGDGYNYYNNAGKRVAFCTIAGERYGESQYMLLVDKELFYNKVKQAGLQPVWFVRILKESSVKASEKYDFFANRDETYMVWKSNKQWKYKKIYSVGEE